MTRLLSAFIRHESWGMTGLTAGGYIPPLTPKHWNYPLLMSGREGKWEERGRVLGVRSWAFIRHESWGMTGLPAGGYIPSLTPKHSNYPLLMSRKEGNRGRKGKGIRGKELGFYKAPIVRDDWPPSGWLHSPTNTKTLKLPSTHEWER